MQAAAAVGGFMAFLAEVGAERDENQQTETRRALDHYAAKLRRPPPRKSAARKTTAAKTAQRPTGAPPCFAEPGAPAEEAVVPPPYCFCATTRPSALMKTR